MASNSVHSRLEYYGANTVIGQVVLGISAGHLHRLWLPNESPVPADGSTSVIHAPHELPLAHEAFRQLEAYLAGRLKQFDLPLPVYHGTQLQQQIRHALCAIPYGETAAYKELGPPRLAARVCSQNPLPLLVPCHRVIPASGGLAHPGQYRGGTALKRYLLRLEAAHA